MLKFMERTKSIDRRILAALAGIPAFFCLCCCGILFLTSANTEPTVAVAQNTADGRLVIVEELIVTAESTNTAVTVEVSSDTLNPANTSRQFNIAGPTDIPQPTNTTRPIGTPTPLSLAGTKTNQTAVPDGDLATVTYIVDSDTIDVAIGGTTHRICYIGMDTPERGDYFFSEATEANRALVESQQVVLVKDVSETDRFGRLLRYVYLEDGTFVNAELVRRGYAVIATFPPDVRHQELFLELEREAREAGRGLWAQPVNPEPTPSDPQPTNVPAPTNVPQPTQPANCDPAYPTICIPPPPLDLDCGEIPYRNFTVLLPDPHRFDGDNDGIGCES